MADALASPLLPEPTMQRVRALCQSFSVRQLDAFGSILTDRFDPVHSDVDLLVQFEDGSDHGWFGRYFDLKNALEAVFGRQVDLVMDREFENPYFRRAVTATRRRLFPAP